MMTNAATLVALGLVAAIGAPLSTFTDPGAAFVDVVAHDAGNAVVDAAVDAAVDPGVEPAADAVVAEVATDAVGAAIAKAVRQRMGDSIQVRVSQLRVNVAESGALRAVPDPGARGGRLVRFTLQTGVRRVGDAVARVDLSGPHVRARQPVARDVPLAAEDIEAVEGELPSVRFEPLPTASDAIGQRVRRAIGIGEVITGGVVIVPDAVRSGDDVRALVRIGAVEAWGTGRTSGSGRVGDVIRVTRGATHTPSRARIVAPGVVEILNVGEVAP